MLITLILSPLLSPQPNPPKQHPNRREKTQPYPPPDPRLLRHPQHAIHRAPKLIPRVFKLVVHFLRQGGRRANLVADEMRQLCV
jgi:hypothetical protein